MGVVPIVNENDTVSVSVSVCPYLIPYLPFFQRRCSCERVERTFEKALGWTCSGLVLPLENFLLSWG